MTLMDALAVFDEAALAALANKGTVRRAARDVEAGLVTLSVQEDDAATVIADGETVRIDIRGPSAAKCTCPAKGMCRHRVAAVLLLRPDVKASDAAPEEDAAASSVAEIVALPEETLRRFAGRAAWRAANEMAQDGAQIASEGKALVVRLSADPVEIRYLPSLGLDGMVSKATPARRKVLHTAALIAIRRQAGIEHDDWAPATADSSLDTIDPLFLAEVRAALAEACRSALALSPLALEERLFTLSVSSRADALQRLALLLRVIARMIRERRSRSFRFDPDHCLAQIALADAISRALPRVTDAEKRAALIGAIRQDYAETGPLTLTGLGAESWRAEGGGRGVTVYLYAAEQDRWFTASLARNAGQDPGFDPARAYRQEAIWGGTTLARVVGMDLTFDSVAVSRQGRLSIGGSRAPSTSPVSIIPEGWKCAFSNWRLLTDRLRHRLAGSQISTDRTAEPVLLRPCRTAACWLDELTQTLNWPIEDMAGNWLTLSVPHDPERAAHIDALATLFNNAFAGSILASAMISGANFTLRPIALLDTKGFCSLDLDTLPQASDRRSLRGGIRALFARKHSGFVPLPRSASMKLLDDVVSELTGVAELGCRPISPAAQQRLELFARRASQSGLETLATAINGVLSATDLPSAILQGLYPIHQLRRQLTALPLVAQQQGG
jgi:hypothetical protein